MSELRDKRHAVWMQDVLRFAALTIPYRALQAPGC